MKLRFKGKIYTVIKTEDVGDPSIIMMRAIVKNRKGEEFTFIHSIIGYFLYDKAGKRIEEAQGATIWT